MQNSQGNNEKKHTTTKLIICIIIIIIIILLLITSCTSSFWGKIGNVFGNSTIKITNNTNDKKENTNKNLYFTEKEKSITLDDSAFKLTYSYNDIIPGDVVCTTSDAEIATCVAYDGYVVVNPKKAGKVTIFATTTVNDIVYKATSEITINHGKNGIRLNSTSGTIILANTDKKNVAYSLSGIKGKVNVKVDDESIATATAKNGVLSIKGLKPGSTKITLTVEYGGKTYTTEYTITVNQDRETTTKKENTTKVDENADLKLNVSFKQLYVKDKFQIKVISGKAIKWQSTNKKVVTVNSKGKITAKGVGTAEIYAYDKKGNKEVVRVTVVAKPKKSKLEISTSYKVLRVGETFTPIITKGKADRWVSSNKKIAKVDKKTGKITAVSPGIVTITASDFWYFGHKVTITVEVISKDTPINPIDPVDPTIPVKPTNPTNPTGPTNPSNPTNPTDPSNPTGPTNPSNPTGPTDPSKPTDPTTPTRPDITVAESRLDMHPGEKYTLTVTPTENVIGYVSSNPAIATVNKNGQIVAKNPGVTTITVTGSNGEKRQVQVYVTNKVHSDDLVIPETRVDMKTGDKHTIIITRGKAIHYESSNNAIASVDSKGVITANGVGTAVITVTGQNNETRQITVVVTKDQVIIEPDSKVEFIDTSKSLTVGDIYTPSVKGTPTKFESSDPTIAEVDPKTGKIVAKSAGTVTITVYDDKGNKDTMTVTVNNPPVDNNVYLELEASTVDLIVGDTEKILIKQGTPTKYESSNSDIVEVDKWGRIKGKKVGSAVIKVTGVYGEVRELVVNVKEDVIPPNPEKEIILIAQDKTMTIGDILSINSLLKQGAFTNATSADNNIVEIVDGKIVARNVGETTVTINGKINSETVKIKVVAEQIILSRPSINMIVGEKQTVDVEQGMDPVIWESSDPSIATVDPNTGEITAVSEGTVTIYAINASGEKTPLIVNVSKSNNTKLEKLDVYIKDTWVPISLGEGVTSYLVEVEPDIELDQYSVVATPVSSGATVKYIYPDGRVEDSLNNLDLEPGDNKVKVVVTAQDGTTQTTYEVNVYKKKSKDAALSVITKKDDGTDVILDVNDSYDVPYKKDSIDLTAKLNDTRSKVTEIKLDDGTVVTMDENGKFNVPLHPGDNEVYITVQPQDETESPVTYTYKIHRAVRTVEFAELTDNTFGIENSPITLEYAVYDDGVETNDYSLNDIKVTSDTFKGTIDWLGDPKNPTKGIVSLKPTKEDIKEHTLKISYKNDESTDSLDIKIVKEKYDITGPEKINALYNEPDKTTFELKFDTKILKYEHTENDGDKPLFKIVKEEGVFKLVSTTDDGGVVSIKYPTSDISNIELIETKDKDGKPLATTSYVVKVTMKKPSTTPKVIGISVNGSIYGDEVTPLIVEVNVRQKYILTLMTTEKNEYLNSFRNTLLEYPIDIGESGNGVEFDLTGIEPFKVADEDNCLVFEFLNWVEVDSSGKEIGVITGNKVLVNKNTILIPKFSDTSKKGEITSSGHISLKSFDLFDADTLYGGNKLIYPGLEGSHTFTIDNDTNQVISIKKIIMEEETICSRGSCLNMGYKVKRTIPNDKSDKYYYGAASTDNSDDAKNASYTILNKDVGESEWKEIEVTDDFTINPGDSAELTVLWRWVDDDENDYKIGEEAVNDSSYKFYIGLDFKKVVPTCDIKSTEVTTTTTK